MAEVRGRLEEMLDRLGQLGATELELEDFKDMWAAAGPASRDHLRHMNDTLLREAIIDARIPDQDGDE